MSYAGSKAKSGRGTVVSIGGVTGTEDESFTPIAEVMQANFSGGKWGSVDVSNFDSGVDDEFITTMRDNGSLALKGNLIDGDPGQEALEAGYDSGNKYDFTVQLMPGPGQSVGSLYALSALIESFFDITVETKSAVEFTSSLKISGPIAKTPGYLITVAATSSSASEVTGTSVTLTATLTTTGGSALAGTVQFFDGANAIGTAETVTAGAATYATAALAVGVHSITAAFTPTGGSTAVATSPAFTQTITAS